MRQQQPKFEVLLFN